MKAQIRLAGIQGALSILLFMHRSLALRMFNVAEIEIGLIEIGFGEHTFCQVGITPFSCWRNEHTSVQNNTQSQSEVKMWRWKVFIRPDLRPLCFPYLHHYLPYTTYLQAAVACAPYLHMSERFRDMSLLTRDPPLHLLLISQEIWRRREEAKPCRKPVALYPAFRWA